MFLLDIGLLMGAIVLKTALTHLTYGSVNFMGFLVGGVHRYYEVFSEPQSFY